MTEDLIIPTGTKEEKYKMLFLQIRSLIEDEDDMTANMANISSMIHRTFGFWWTGFYRVADSGTLVLGPFQGPVACTRIPYGKGVCGTSWKLKETLIVPDVDAFPGHIACSSASRSEITVPVFKNDLSSDETDREVIAILDIDSDELDTFDECDRLWLEKIVDLLHL